MQRKSKILSLILSLVFVFAIGLTACGGGGGGKTPSSQNPASNTNTQSATSTSEEEGDVAYVKFWGDGDDTELNVFNNLTSQFNAAHAGEIFVDYEPQDNIGTALTGDLGTSSAPDVFYVGDSNYKKYVEAGYVADITAEVNASTLINPSEMWDSIYGRYYYSTENHRSGANAQNGKWYGLPKDIGPTVLYYNEDWFNHAGVYVISCFEEDLEAFNNGGQDAYGNTKSKVYSADHSSNVSISGTVPAKGFFSNGSYYFFNNKIAMNWEETRTLAALLEAHTMPGVTQEAKGYHTEWWFNYGWSVGGDCIEYVETTDAQYTGGFYDFTLVDNTKNFIVADDAADVVVNGNTYKAGEIISYNDKLTNELELAGVTDRAAIAQYDTAVTNGVTNGTILELPSQREAFVEFVLLSTDKDVEIDGINGYDVCQKPSSMGGDGAKTTGFQGQTVGMLVDGRWNVTNFRTEAVSFHWDVAPLPIYKEYNPDGSVKVHGITAGHSGSVALCINSHSDAKDAAWKFIEFLAGPEGQTAQSEQGFAIPSQKALAMGTDNGPNGGGVFLNQKDDEGGLLRPFNAIIFIEAAACEHEGDWSYLRTGSAWIDDWADALNNQVRNGTLTFNDFISGPAFQNTFAMIKEYTKA